MIHHRPIAIAAFAFLSGPFASTALLAQSEAVFSASPLGMAIAVSETELSAQRGRYQPDLVQLNSQQLKAALEDNSAIGTANGENSIAKQAFTNAQGHLSVIQNSGNNVIIQDTTIYNITFID